jgi:hypothetical protein
MTKADTAAGTALFWTLADALVTGGEAQRGTLMGFDCLRTEGGFLATVDRKTGDLIVKLSRERVAALVAAGEGRPFAPAGKVFREWVAIPEPDRRRWRALLAEGVENARGRA